MSEQLKPSTGWISVEDRLPEPNQKVLISNGDNIGHARLHSSSLYWLIVASNDGVPLSDVTHWMPLPAPPQ